jgi:hypothetical protein
MIAPQAREATDKIIAGWLELRKVRGNSELEQLSIDEALRQIATALRLFGVELLDHIPADELEHFRRTLLS